MRHFPRRSITGDMEIIDREFDFVRAVLPYDYRFTCNAQHGQAPSPERPADYTPHILRMREISFGE
jgi:hypothetical protein